MDPQITKAKLSLIELKHKYPGIYIPTNIDDKDLPDYTHYIKMLILENELATMISYAIQLIL